MKRSVKMIGMAVLPCLLIGGCKMQTEKDRLAAAQDRQEISLWVYYETDQQKESLEELAKGFNESQDEYLFRWEYHGPVTEFNKTIAIGITQNQLPDMVIVDNPDMRRYVEQGILEDLTDRIGDLEYLDQYYPNALESVTHNGRYYGLPFCCNNAALIYNRDAFQEKNLEVPETWEEFLQCAAALTEDGRKGFAMSAIKGEQSAFQILPFILSAGDDINQLGGQGTEDAFSLVSRLVDEGSMSKDCINWSQNDVAWKFVEGECAMMENGPWVLPVLEASGVNYAIAQLPYKQRPMAVTGGENIGVIKGKNVDGAVAFMRYCNQEEPMLRMNEKADSIPPRRDVARKMMEAHPEYEIFAKQMETSISRASCEKWLQVTGALSEAQMKVITGQMTPQEARGAVGEKAK